MELRILLRNMTAEPPETVFEKFDMVRLEMENVESAEEVPEIAAPAAVSRRFEVKTGERAVMDS